MKLVAIDLDGTLMHEDCTISDYSKKMITEASKAGIVVVPTSGRCFRNIKKQMEGVEGVRYCICGNGSVVADLQTEEILYNNKIPAAVAYDIYKEVRKNQGFVEIYSDTDTYVENDVRHILFETKMGEYFCNSMMATDVPILSANLLLKRGLMGVNKFHVAFPAPDDMKRFAEFCRKKEEVTVTYPSDYNMEVFEKASNKDIGMELLCKRLGIAREDTIAIGDSSNDVSMIQYAHVGIAVENSMDVLKEAADYVTKSNEEDGPAYELEKLVTIQPSAL